MILHPMTSMPVQPYCARCDLPVHRISLPVVQPSQWYFQFEVQCCGATRAHRLSSKEVLRISLTNEKFWAVEGRAKPAAIRKLANLGR